MNLDNSDKFLIMASDGVWEFISSEESVRMVNPFWERNDPEGAVNLLVKKSVEHWRREDDVIDDITAIVVFFDIQNQKASIAQKQIK